MIDRDAIRTLATEHIRELGLDRPPFDYLASLASRKLTLLPDPLETILAESPLSPLECEKIDGFIHLEQRIVCLRGDLHPHQHRTGVLHELAHDIIPWQRELLYYCPIFTLPEQLQASFEREANLFAAECSFFADRFVEEVHGHPYHLASAVALAKAYGTSYEATFRHYVECHPAACLLLISTLISADASEQGALWEVRQYIRSSTGEMRGRVKERFRAPELTAFVDPNVWAPDIVEHEVIARIPTGEQRYAAQSFWNTYKLFTLVWL